MKNLENLIHGIRKETGGGRIFHYTDLTAVKGILETGEIWMTHASFLNDNEEIQHGYELLKRLSENAQTPIQNLAKNLEGVLESSNAFVASFSRACDSLSQWRGYCPPSAGYCIELEGDSNKLFPCLYEEEKKKDYFLKIINREVKSDPDKEIIFQNVIKRLLSMKHEGFAEEKEVRRVYFQREGIHFRNRAGINVPYVKERIDLSDIYAIWIGPGENKELRKEGMEHYLDMLVKSPDYSLSTKPDIRLSKIPLR